MMLVRTYLIYLFLKFIIVNRWNQAFTDSNRNSFRKIKWTECDWRETKALGFFLFFLFLFSNFNTIYIFKFIYQDIVLKEYHDLKILYNEISEENDILLNKVLDFSEKMIKSSAEKEFLKSNSKNQFSKVLLTNFSIIWN